VLVNVSSLSSFHLMHQYEYTKAIRLCISQVNDIMDVTVTSGPTLIEWVTFGRHKNTCHKGFTYMAFNMFTPCNKGTTVRSSFSQLALVHLLKS